MDEDPTARAAYDRLAGTYVEEVRTNPYNADLEFPGTTSLIPEVEGRRVLDAGCGTGRYTEWLCERGAETVGLDLSRGMILRAAARAGGADLVHADLGRPLPLATDSFDVAVSALALGYVASLPGPFEELARVLRPDGVLVFSIGHPFDRFPPDGVDEADVRQGAADYFDTERVVKQRELPVPCYRRPLSAVVNPLLEAGFRLDELLEPQPTAAFREKRPERYEKESRYPVFLCVRAVNGTGRGADKEAWTRTNAD